MAPVTNKCIIFKEFLQGINDATRAPIPGTYVPGQMTAFDDTQTTIDVGNVPLNGGISLKMLVLSLELYVLAKMRPGLLTAADTYKAGDTYWDNVGGEILEAALNAAARYAHFIQCGMLSGYFHGSTSPIRTLPDPNVSQNIVNVLLKEISMHGFIVFSLLLKYLEAFLEQIPKLAASEEVTKGLENAEAALDRFLKGASTGKGIVVVADEL